MFLIHSWQHKVNIVLHANMYLNTSKCQTKVFFYAWKICVRVVCFSSRVIIQAHDVVLHAQKTRTNKNIILPYAVLLFVSVSLCLCVYVCICILFEERRIIKNLLYIFENLNSSYSSLYFCVVQVFSMMSE